MTHEHTFTHFQTCDECSEPHMAICYVCGYEEEENDQFDVVPPRYNVSNERTTNEKNQPIH